MFRYRLIFSAVAAAFVVITVFSTPLYAQLCPNADASTCSAEYDDCMANCEGKDGDWQTCPNIVCPGVYDYCMNGNVWYTTWTYPVVSKTVEHGCVWGCTSWACTCWLHYGDSAYTEYEEFDTHYQEIETETRHCQDNSLITVVAQTIDHPSRNCYFRYPDQSSGNGCSVTSVTDGTPDTYSCLGNDDCFINDDGASVRFTSTP